MPNKRIIWTSKRGCTRRKNTDQDRPIHLNSANINQNLKRSKFGSTCQNYTSASISMTTSGNTTILMRWNRPRTTTYQRESHSFVNPTKHWVPLKDHSPRYFLQFLQPRYNSSNFYTGYNIALDILLHWICYYIGYIITLDMLLHWIYYYTDFIFLYMVL